VAKNASTSQYGTIVAMDESPVQEDLIYAGTDDGLIQVTEDGGANWRRIEKFPGVPDRTYVNDIIASQHEKNTVYAAFNNHKNGDFKPYILKSRDAGKTWTSISSDLPERGSVYALAEDHVRKNLLFAGTEFGLFVSMDGGQHWKQLKSGLPTIAVRDIAIQKRENDLALATFGRGFYILDDYTPLRYLNKEILSSESQIFPIKDALMYVESSPLGSGGAAGKGFQGEMYFNAKNPPLGAVFTYHLKESVKTLRDKRQEKEKKAFKEGKPVDYPTYDQMKAEEKEETPYLVFTILDEEGNVVRKLRTSARAGMHRIVWDLKYPAVSPTNLRDTNPASSGGSSTLALPGKYKVFLSKNVSGKVTRLSGPVDFNAVVLGNTSLPAEDRAELAAFQKKVRELSRAVNAASSVVRELGDKVRHYKVALKNVTVDDSQIYAQIRALEFEVNEIQIKLFGDRTLRRVDKDAEPGLSSRLNGIIRDQWRSTSAPTQTHRDAYLIVADEFSPTLQKLKKIVEVDAKQIEKKLDKIGAPYTPGRFPDWKK
ncbi:MAG: exo-alpha-sialidase, partial [Candidatus Aminicenantes bacterium]|nr:exo-alpha-sialidase [Candidatus Aminicenantes bacterium]